MSCRHMKVSGSDAKLTFPFFNVKWSIYTHGGVKLTGSPSPLCPHPRYVPGTSALYLSALHGLGKPSSHPNPTRCSCTEQTRNRSWRKFWEEICHFTKCCLIIAHLVVFHKERGFSFQTLNIFLQHQPECFRDREERTLTALLEAMIVLKAGESHPVCALTAFKAPF